MKYVILLLLLVSVAVDDDAVRTPVTPKPEPEPEPVGGVLLNAPFSVYMFFPVYLIYRISKVLWKELTK